MRIEDLILLFIFFLKGPYLTVDNTLQCNVSRHCILHYHIDNKKRIEITNPTHKITIKSQNFRPNNKKQFWKYKIKKDTLVLFISRDHIHPNISGEQKRVVGLEQECS